jgi:signal transduction histidine kinase
MLVQVLSKVIGTVPVGGSLSISVAQSTTGNHRGIEILIQDSERPKNGRVANTGPEQDILKHWISESGLSMALAHKIIKAHGGSITAAGVAGMSVTVTIRLPYERVVSRGLISPPTETDGRSGLVVQRPELHSQNSII